MDQFGIESSLDVKIKYFKIMLWGDTGTRKTEFPLRFFPDVLVIDSEGNTDQCVDMPEIPEFLRIKTKDIRKVLDILKAVKQGKIKFSDGRPVRTVSIDSASVFWGVQQTVAYTKGEERAAKKGYGDGGAQQLDWVIAKRPLKDLYLELAGSTIEYLFLIAREKDPYQTDEEKKQNKPKVMIPDVVKNTTYEMNLALHFVYDEGNKWFAEVTKTQGGMSTFFPKGKKLTKIPFDELFAYAKKIDKSTEAPEEQSEDDIAKQIANDTQPHTSAGLLAYGKEKGCTPAEVGAALKVAKITAFDPNKWTGMVTAIDQYITEKAKLVPA
ncbi:MAG: hypothetical protein ABSE06_12315 [Anaerolineaceae bacterium]|jgi:hypothetical protein